MSNSVSTTGFSAKIEEEIDSAYTSETVGYIALESTATPIRTDSAKVSETKYYPYDVIREEG